MGRALLVIDMQKGFLTGEGPCYGSAGLAKRINELSVLFRKKGLPVMYIRYCGAGSVKFRKDVEKWELLGLLDKVGTFDLIETYGNDVFENRKLKAGWPGQYIGELVITGCATDFGVESTFRSALARNFRITVVSDCHTTWERRDLAAARIIEDYNRAWRKTGSIRDNITVECLNDLILRIMDIG